MLRGLFLTGTCIATVILGLAANSMAKPQEGGGGSERRAVARDRQNVRQDTRDIQKDRQQIRQDRKNGEDGAADRKELQKDKQDLRQDQESRRENEVDNRENRQEHRIQQGVKNGSLTPEELATLETQQKSIASLEDQFKSDGKLTRDEFKQLNEQLNTASRCIFAEKHDTDGNQMSVYRLGKNVKLNSDIAAKLADPNLDKAQARKFAQDFHEILNLKHKLAADNLTDEQRTALQSQYDALVNQYFTVA